LKSRKCGPHAQHRHEASEEDHFPPVPAKEVEAQFELALVQADVPPVAAQQAEAALAAHPKPHVIPQDGEAFCCENDQGMDNRCVVPAKMAATSSMVSPGKGIPVLSMAIQAKMAQ